MSNYKYPKYKCPKCGAEDFTRIVKLTEEWLLDGSLVSYGTKWSDVDEESDFLTCHNCGYEDEYFKFEVEAEEDKADTEC